VSVWDQYESTIGAALKGTARRLPDTTAIIFDDRGAAPQSQSWTWAETDERSDRIAVWLIAQGIERGDRVGVMCTIRPDYLLIYLACAKIGAILVGFNALYKGQEVVQLVTKTTPKILFVIERDKDRLVHDEIVQALAGKPDCEIIPIYLSEPQRGILPAALAVTPSPQNQVQLRERLAEVSASDGFLIVFTSGSTGVPKAVVLTHRNLIVNLAVQIRSFQMKPSDRFIINLPLNHVGAATELVVPSILLGSSMVLIERFHPQHTLDVIARHHVTFLHQTPSMYIMEFNLQGYETFDLSSLRAMSVAGAPTPPPVMQKMMQAVPQVFTGYGMTEMVGFITYTEPGDAPDTISYTVGKIAPEFQLKIVDNERQEQPIGTRGEVALRGDCRFYAYFADDSSTREVIDEDGWYYSGDIGVLDERNYLTLVDRKKLMFITGGYNVYPREIEDYVSSYAAVEFAACLPKPHDVMGEVGVLFVKVKDNEAPNAEAIRQHCIAGLAEYKIPREIRFLDDFPLTPLGKIDRQRLRPLV
jgi:acyl-CoA synthetase (AMP-forming)/AMP-acid ligase II